MSQQTSRLGPWDATLQRDLRYGSVDVGNSPSTSGPTVTINQASGQADPAQFGDIMYDVVFSEAVTGFSTGDTVFTGSTTGGVLIGTVAGSGTTYTVAVSGMAGAGDVVATIPPGVATSIATGSSNQASTSTDNTVTWDPVVAAFIWNFSSGGTSPWPISPVSTTTVVAGQYLILCCNYRGTGAAAPIQTVLSGTATISAITALRGPNTYDGAGTSRGACQFWQATVTVGGTLNVVNALQDYLQWALVLNSSAVVQQSGNVSTSQIASAGPLGVTPTGPVLSVCNYGGDPGTGGQSTGTPPTGWGTVAHAGSQSPHAKYVQIFGGTAGSISYDLGAAAVGAGSGAGGREETLFEITP